MTSDTIVMLVRYVLILIGGPLIERGWTTADKWTLSFYYSRYGAGQTYACSYEKAAPGVPGLLSAFCSLRTPR